METSTLNKAKELIGKIESLYNELSDLFTGLRYKANTVGVVPQMAMFVSSSPRPGLKYGKEDAPPKKTKKTHNMTPEGRAAISAAAKKRWAAFKKAKKAAKIA